MLAPIVLFTYNRPLHTKLVLDALAENTEAANSILHVYCDGPKEGESADTLKNISDVKSLVNAESRFKEIRVFEQKINIGLADSIIKGVSETLERFDRLIVLEDDITPSRGFLEYMNNALNLYNHDYQVGCIHGWNYNLDTRNQPESTFFLKGADCWGWATWARSWKNFNPNGQELLDNIYKRGLSFEFNRRGTHQFITMLQDQIDKKNNSWAIRWHASLILANNYCLHPTKPIVKNIGLDNSGVHCGNHSYEQNPVDYIELRKIKIEEGDWFFNEYRALEKNNATAEKPYIWQTLKRGLKRLLRH